MIFNNMTTFCFTLIVAIVLENICIRSQDPDVTAKSIQEIRLEMASAKSSLSNVFFVLFSEKCLILIQASLNIIYAMNDYAEQYKIVFSCIVAYSMFELLYIAWIVDETVDSYKSLKLKIRLYAMNIEIFTMGNKYEQSHIQSHIQGGGVKGVIPFC